MLKQQLNLIKEDYKFISLFATSLFIIGILMSYHTYHLVNIHTYIFLILSLSILYYFQKTLFSILSIILLGFTIFNAKIYIKSIYYKPCLVTSKPTQVRGIIKDIDHTDNRTTILLDNIILANSNQFFIDYKNNIIPKNTKLSIKDNKHKNLALGDEIECNLRFKPISPNTTPHSIDSRFFAFFNNLESYSSLHKEDIEYIESYKNQVSYLKKYQHNLKQFFENALGENADIAKASILNVKSNIDPKIIEKFQNTGTSHLLAISGLHIAVIILMGIYILKAYMFAIYRCTSYKPKHNMHYLGKIIGSVLALFYILISNFSFSALRAYIMTVIAINSFYINRKVPLIFKLNITILIILLFYPESIFYPSFQLSAIVILFFALSSMMIKSEKINEIIHSLLFKLPLSIRPKKETFEKLSSIIIKPLLTILIAGLSSLPVAAYHFQTVSVQTILANLIITPYFSIIVLPSLFLLTLFGKLIFFLAPLISLQIDFLKFLLSLFEYLSYNISISYIHPEPIWFYGICSFLIVCTSFLRYIGYTALLSGFIGCFLVKKPDVMLIDYLGRISYIKDQELHTSYKADSFYTQQILSFYNKAAHVNNAKRFTKTLEEKQELNIRNKLNYFWEINNLRIAFINNIKTYNQGSSENLFLIISSSSYINGAKHHLHLSDLYQNGGYALLKTGKLYRYQDFSGKLPWLYGPGGIRI